MIPVLLNFDNSKPPVGMVDISSGRIIVTFEAPVTRDEFFEVFGHCGVRLIEGDVESFTQVEIVSFSLTGMIAREG